jgi:hypothetical protein
MNGCLAKMKSVPDRASIFLGLCPARSGLRALPSTMSSQVADFSAVNATFHAFRPISQLEGIDFSPVTRFCPEILFWAL